MRTWMPSASGTLQRVLLIDARRGLVSGQYIYDQSGKTLLASAVAESQRYDPIQQISTPQVVSIRLPPANIALKINLGNVQINQLSADPAQLWNMPTFDGAPQYNLGGAPAGSPLPGRGAIHPLNTGIVPASYPAYPTTSYPVTPAAIPSGPSVRSSEARPLPMYGRRY
jgi:hypothetical protein